MKGDGVTLTFDHNAIIDLLRHNEWEPSWRCLLGLHDRGQITVRVVGIGASELLRGRKRAKTFDPFRDLLTEAGIEHLPILTPPLWYGVTYWGESIWVDDNSEAVIEKIHGVLWPEVPLNYVDYCERSGKMVDEENVDHVWLNKLCDTLTMWSHIQYGGDMFVSRDKHFLLPFIKPRLLELGAGEILTPQEAATILLG